MKLLSRLIALSATFIFASAFAQTPTLQEDVAALQHGWAAAYYHAPGDEQEESFERLVQTAEQVATRHAGQAEPMIWQAIILSSYAKVEGGLGALSAVKQARDLLLAAEKINPAALDGSVYTSLGSLYAKVPRWPIGFGDRKQARAYLDRALVLNPDGIDPNFFYGELLLEQGDKASAAAYLRKALAAPPRPDREDADGGRREEVKALLVKAQSS